MREDEAAPLDVETRVLADRTRPHAADGGRRSETKRSTAATVPATRGRPARCGRPPPRPAGVGPAPGAARRRGPRRRSAHGSPHAVGHAARVRASSWSLDHAAGQCNVSLDLSWAASHRQFSSKDVSVSVGHDRCVSRQALQVRPRHDSSATPPPAISSGSQGAPKSGDTAAASKRHQRRDRGRSRPRSRPRSPRWRPRTTGAAPRRARARPRGEQRIRRARRLAALGAGIGNGADAPCAIVTGQP